MNFKAVTAVFAAALLMSGCGGSGSSDEPGTLNLSLTDATVGSILELRLFVTGVTIKPENGPPVSYEVDLTSCEEAGIVSDDCNPLNLLAYRNGVVLTLLSNQRMEPGRYEWLRLEVDNDQSFVIPDNGGMEPIDIRVPSARGLQLSGFVIMAGQRTDLVMDWDAYQGLTNPVGQEGYILKPVIRYTDLSEYGTLMGSVGPVLMAGQCSEGGAVYVYEGEVVPDDVDNNETNPLVTAMVEQREDGSWGYEVHYLQVGTYTTALMCEEDTIPATEAVEDGDDPMDFIDPQIAEIADGQTTTIDFEAS